MRKIYLALSLLTGLLLLSCNPDDEDIPDSTPAYIGTYTLTTVTSNKQLDPDVTGDFLETEIIDNIDCSSLLILNEDQSFSWDFLGLSQIVNNVAGVTSYFEMECFVFSGGTGQYQVNNNGISFVFDSSVSNTNAIIGENSITVSINEELAVDNGGEVQLGNVQLTIVYKK